MTSLDSDSDNEIISTEISFKSRASSRQKSAKKKLKSSKFSLSSLLREKSDKNGSAKGSLEERIDNLLTCNGGNDRDLSSDENSEDNIISERSCVKESIKRSLSSLSDKENPFNEIPSEIFEDGDEINHNLPYDSILEEYSIPKISLFENPIRLPDFELDLTNFSIFRDLDLDIQRVSSKHFFLMVQSDFFLNEIDVRNFENEEGDELIYLLIKIYLFYELSSQHTSEQRAFIRKWAEKCLKIIDKYRILVREQEVIPWMDQTISHNLGFKYSKGASEGRASNTVTNWVIGSNFSALRAIEGLVEISKMLWKKVSSSTKDSIMRRLVIISLDSEVGASCWGIQQFVFEHWLDLPALARRDTIGRYKFEFGLLKTIEKWLFPENEQLDGFVSSMKRDFSVLKSETGDMIFDLRILVPFMRKIPKVARIGVFELRTAMEIYSNSLVSRSTDEMGFLRIKLELLDLWNIYDFKCHCPNEIPENPKKFTLKNLRKTLVAIQEANSRIVDARVQYPERSNVKQLLLLFECRIRSEYSMLKTKYNTAETIVL